MIVLRLVPRRCLAIPLPAVFSPFASSSRLAIASLCHASCLLRSLRSAVALLYASHSLRFVPATGVRRPAGARPGAPTRKANRNALTGGRATRFLPPAGRALARWGAKPDALPTLPAKLPYREQRPNRQPMPTAKNREASRPTMHVLTYF